jgi:NAD-dependent dihydropyrimidine dehydrogenase PreA subunit
MDRREFFKKTIMAGIAAGFSPLITSGAKSKNENNINYDVVALKNGTACAACDEMCPTGATHMINYKNGLPAPIINSDICIGCGACEYACPTLPKKAIIVEPFTEHKKIKDLPTKDKVATTDKDKEFAF